MAEQPKDLTKQRQTPENGRAVRDTKQPNPTNQNIRKSDPTNDDFADDEEE